MTLVMKVRGTIGTTPEEIRAEMLALAFKLDCLVEADWNGLYELTAFPNGYFTRDGIGERRGEHHTDPPLVTR